LALERDLTSVVRFRILCQVVSDFSCVPTMAENDEDQQSLSAMVGTIEGDITAIKSALERMAQAIERISLKNDNRRLANDMY